MLTTGRYGVYGSSRVQPGPRCSTSPRAAAVVAPSACALASDWIITAAPTLPLLASTIAPPPNLSGTTYTYAPAANTYVPNPTAAAVHHATMYEVGTCKSQRSLLAFAGTILIRIRAV